MWQPDSLQHIFVTRSSPAAIGLSGIVGSVMEVGPADQAVASASMGRFFGAANVGYAVLFWLMRGAAASDARTAVVNAVSIGFGVGCLVSLTEQLSGTFGLLGWSNVALYGIFAAVYGYFGFGKGAEA